MAAAPWFRQKLRTLRYRASRRWRLLLAALQRNLRSSEAQQIFLCAIAGGIVGALVEGMRRLVELLHRFDFLLPPDTLLSAGVGVDRWRILIIPAAGGLILGLTALIWRRYRPAEIVDPIEAKALHGGGLFPTDQTRPAPLTLISNGGGASPGMGAGCFQLAGGGLRAVG